MLYFIKEPPNIMQRPCRGGYQPPAMFLVLGGWLNGKMLENCTNSPEMAPFFVGGTAQEADSLPYRGWVKIGAYHHSSDCVNQINAALSQHKPLFAQLQGAFVIGLHGVHQAEGIGHGGGFAAAVHGQLGQADVGGGDGDVGDGDAA